jgi:hypothetical protein
MAQMVELDSKVDIVKKKENNKRANILQQGKT